MKYRILKSVIALGLFTISTLALAPAAHASSPADLTVGMGFRDQSGTLSPLNNVGIQVNVVDRQPSAGPHIPINYAPYSGNMLSPGGGNPTTNQINFLADQGTANGLFGGSFAYRAYNNLMWCGDSQGIPLGEFQIDVSVQTITPNIINYGGVRNGHWVGYWHFESGNTSDTDRGFTGTSTRTFAKNPYRTFVYFEFVEDPAAGPQNQVQGYKVERRADGQLPPNTGDFQDALVRADSAFTSSNPFYLFGLNPASSHTIRAEDSNDWLQDGYYMEASPVGGGAVGATASGGPGSYVIQGPQYPGTKYDMRWFYRPKVSDINMGILARDSNGNIVNPCSSSDPGIRNLCGQGSLSTSRTTGFPALGGYATSGGGAPQGSNNIASVGNLYYGDYSVTLSSLPGGWRVYGSVTCLDGQAVDCYSTNGVSVNTSQSYGVNIGPNRSRITYYVLESNISVTNITLTCSTVSGVLASAPGLNAGFYLEGDSTPLAENIPTGNFSITVPDKFKDGITRRLKLIVKTPSGNTLRTIDTGRDHVCQNAATCGANTLADAFRSGAGDISSTGVKVKFVMNNTGDSLWKNKDVASGGWSTGQHRLVFSPAAAQFWSVDSDERGIPDGVIANSQSVTKPGSYTFTVTLKPKAGAITAPSIPVEWGMAFVDTSGAIKEQIGAYCKDTTTPTVTLRGDYSPWLRVQNGSTASLGAIKGQLNNGSAENTTSVRGTRKLLGTNQALNADTTYLVMAYAGGSRFCSSNAYLLGQGIDTSGCSGTFGPYKFGLQTNQLAAYYDDVAAIAAAGSCTTYNVTQPPSRASERAAAIVNKDPNTLAGSIGAAGGCPAYYKSTGAAITSARTLTSGRATLLSDGNFSINANITATQPTALSYTQNGDLGDLNVPSLGILVKGDVFITGNVTRIDAFIYATGRIYTCSDYPSTAGTNSAELPAQTAARVQKCSQRLVVSGGLYAAGGFAFGRSYFEAKGVGVAKTDATFDTQPVGANNTLPQGPYYGGPAEDIIGNGLSFLLTPPGFEAGVKNEYDRPMYLQGDFTPRF